MQGWANENIKEVLDCTILGYAANYTRGENTSHTQKILDQGKSAREEKPRKEVNTASLI